MSDSSTPPTSPPELAAPTPVPKEKRPMKAINKPFTVHQRYKADKAAKEAAAAKDGGKSAKETTSGSSFGSKLLWWTILSILTSIFLSRTVTETWTWGYDGKYAHPAAIYRSIFPPKNRYFSEHELAQYDGSHPGKPVYLAIDGDVYDVTKGKSYAPGGGYHFFAGRDAARAYVTGCFKTHLTHDTRGFGKKEIRSLEHWKDFFKNHKTYHRVGTVVHPPIDPDSPLPEPCNGHGS